MTQRTKHERRHQIGVRDGWCCNFCLRPTQCPTCDPDADLPATLDHIIPKSQGGTDSLANLAIACKLCNEAKADGIWPNEYDRMRLAGHPELRKAGRGSNRYTRKYRRRSFGVAS